MAISSSSHSSSSTAPSLERPGPADGESTQPGAGRPMGGRSALPGGRAVVGGLLVTLAALGTFVAHRSAAAGPTTSVVVAERELAAGETIHAGDLRLVPADLPDGVRDTLFGSITELEGAVTLAAIDPAQAVPRRSVSTSATPDQQRSHDLSFALDRPRALNGRLRSGERIDLIATYGTGTDARTAIVARGVRVVEVDSPTSGGVASSAKVTVTIALDGEADIVRTANALEVAQVTLVRSTGTEPDTTTSTDTGTGDADADEDEDDSEQASR